MTNTVKSVTATIRQVTESFDGHEFTFYTYGLLDWGFQSNIHVEICGTAACLAEAKVKAMKAIGYDPFH